MYRMIFQYRWAAVLFVLLMVGTAVQLVGTGEKDGQLAEMQQQVIDQRDQSAAITDADEAKPEPEEDPLSDAEEGFSDDSDLVLDAEGFNPNPDEAEEEPPVNLVRAEAEETT